MRKMHHGCIQRLTHDPITLKSSNNIEQEPPSRVQKSPAARMMPQIGQFHEGFGDMRVWVSAALGLSMAALTAAAPAMAQQKVFRPGGGHHGGPGGGGHMGGFGGGQRPMGGSHHGFGGRDHFGGGPRFNGGRDHFGGGGAAVGAGIAGLAAGALIGGAIANQGYGNGYGYAPGYGGYGYDAPPVYAGSEPVYQAAPAGDAESYCASRYKSYDASSGTYLGYDGARHPCP